MLEDVIWNSNYLSQRSQFKLASLAEIIGVPNDILQHPEQVFLFPYFYVLIILKKGKSKLLETSPYIIHLKFGLSSLAYYFPPVIFLRTPRSVR